MAHMAIKVDQSRFCFTEWQGQVEVLQLYSQTLADFDLRGTDVMAGDSNRKSEKRMGKNTEKTWNTEKQTKNKRKQQQPENLWAMKFFGAPQSFLALVGRIWRLQTFANPFYMFCYFSHDFSVVFHHVSNRVQFNQCQAFQFRCCCWIWSCFSGVLGCNGPAEEVSTRFVLIQHLI